MIPVPDAPWVVTQLIPSPEVAFESRAHFGLRWQITPLLYSWGVNRRVEPWRFFIAEPIVRNSGSIEAFVTPEWIQGRPSFLRPGLRTYLPVKQHGEYLSVSIGTSITPRGVAYEVGVYALYGVLGLQVTVSPSKEEAPCIVTLRVRYF